MKAITLVGRLQEIGDRYGAGTEIRQLPLGVLESQCKRSEQIGMENSPLSEADRVRFWSYVEQEPNSGCWLWTGAINGCGYGFISVSGEMHRAHRVAFELCRGAIPEGLQLDHLCRVRRCVNPDHLDPVSQRENVLRGTGITAANAAKTHCPRGHAYADNAYVRPGRTDRECRLCNKERHQRYRQAIKERQAGVETTVPPQGSCTYDKHAGLPSRRSGGSR
jgi:hypothetical protein